MLILMLGWHWSILQCVAWIGMTVEYSQSMPVSAAVVKAVSGDEPCNMCQFVAHERQQEKQGKEIFAALKGDLLWESASLFISPPVLANLILIESIGGNHLVDSPPTPPPRFV